MISVSLRLLACLAHRLKPLPSSSSTNNAILNALHSTTLMEADVTHVRLRVTRANLDLHVSRALQEQILIHTTSLIRSV